MALPRRNVPLSFRALPLVWSLTVPLTFVHHQLADLRHVPDQQFLDELTGRGITVCETVAWES